MMLTQITYYFGEESLRDCFESCMSALFAALSTEKAMNLTKTVTISEEIIEREERETNEGEILIDSPRSLKEAIEGMIEGLDLSIDQMFLTDQEISDQVEHIIAKLDQEGGSLTKDISFSYTKDSNMETLLNVVYCREMAYTYPDDSPILQYEDFCWDAFTNRIDQYVQNIKADRLPALEVEWDHLGGDLTQGEFYVDLYYKFTLPTKNIPIKFTTDPNASENGDYICFATIQLSDLEEKDGLKQIEQCLDLIHDQREGEEWEYWEGDEEQIMFHRLS